MFSELGTFLRLLFTFIIGAILLAAGTVVYFIVYYGSDLPDYSSLARYSPPTTTRLYSEDGKMLTEYAKEKRLFVPITAIPKKLINAFIAAEDQNFYHHPGVDFMGVLRAATQNIVNSGSNKSLSGGSTITQQVVKNFLLSNEKSIERKVKEAILAFRITNAFPKDKIMELYLNQIYLGNRSYGVAAAALNYFNKSLDELTIEEAAMLAALPKAPSSLDPARYPEKAKTRRDWVIKRMEEEGYINDIESLLSQSKPIILAKRDDIEIVNGGFFTDAVKYQLEQMFGEEKVMEGGLSVRTTLDPIMQKYAEEAMMNGLNSYDRRHGWRGPVAKITMDGNWQENFKQVSTPPAIGKWQMAVVNLVKDNNAEILFADGSSGVVPLKYVVWARKYLSNTSMGGQVKKISDVLAKGDVILVDKIVNGNIVEYSLEQIPTVNGSIVAMDPHTGRVLAMVGGYYYGGSQFNRAVQAKRQPGSAFKPFVYLAALENGYAPNSIIIDEEVQIGGDGITPEWRPKNYSGDYYGPTTLRIGLEKSRNTMTVRLAQLIGIEKIIDVAQKFDINKNPPRNFSIVLGAAETDLLSLTNAYAELVNGGKKISPSLIEKIQDSNGKIIYRRDERPCENCVVKADLEVDDILQQKYQVPPILTDDRSSVVDPITAYQMVSMLNGVIERGTGQSAKSLNRVLAGKTGTTNESYDAWFIGFSADLAVGVYVGFDNPVTLGRHETGAMAALPIWKEFMQNALQGTPDIPFRRPEGVKIVKIDAKTGLLPTPDTQPGDLIYEAFRDGTEPTTSSNTGDFNDGGEEADPDLNNLGTGGVY